VISETAEICAYRITMAGQEQAAVKSAAPGTSEPRREGFQVVKVCCGCAYIADLNLSMLTGR